jgi:hypothetical protein
LGAEKGSVALIWNQDDRDPFGEPGRVFARDARHPRADRGRRLNLSIASEGTATALGPAISSSYIAFEDTYVYWVDNTTVGTIMKAPKAGGGTATVLARDTSPTTIAVDANAVDWSDSGGYIKSIPK